MKTRLFHLSRANPKGASLWVCLFFIAALALGLLTAGAYGQPWDEPDEMNILRMNLWQYALSLGRDPSAFEAFAARERASPQSLLEAPVPISQSPERDHGISAYYPLAGMVMSPSLSPARQMLLWHLHTWLLFWLGAVALYFVCRRLGLSRPMACLGALMLLLTPRFFAEGHYNNKDIPLFSFTLLCLWQSLRLMERPRWDGAVLLGLAGALAANTKVAGLALWGLCGVAAVVHLAIQRRWNRRVLGLAFLCLASFAAFYALLTPALWADPAGFLRYCLTNATGFTRWEGMVLFRGAVFDTATQPLPRYYLPYMMLVTIPLWVWLLLGLGQLLAAKSILSRRSPLGVPLLLCSLLWLAPLLFAVAARTPVYNGWRHFYFLYGPMLALAAYGLSRLWAWVRAFKVRRALLCGLLGLGMLLTGTGMALNHPFEYVAWNPLLMGKDINAFLERDYWNVSVTGVLEKLEQTPAVQEAPWPVVTVAGVDLWAQVGLDRALAVMDSPRLRSVNCKTSPPDYWLVNHTYANFSHWKPTPAMELAARVEAYGAPLVSVYRRAPAAPSP